jgi:hypothetical protein
MNFIIKNKIIMKTAIVKIDHLVEIPELKEYYSAQSIDELANSIELDNGMRTPIIVTEKYEVIDGYRRLNAMKSLGKEHIDVLIDAVEPTIFERIIRNMYRTKSTEDKVKEIKAVFEKYPKRMGKKSDDGEVYNRNEKIAKALSKKYSGKETIARLEEIINNDLKDNSLTKGIIENNWKIDTTYDFLTKWKAIDEEKKYGYSNKLLNGEINISEANKFIKEHLELENDKQTFIIPEKCYAYNKNCTEIDKIDEFKNKIQLVFTYICIFYSWFFIDLLF